MMIDWRRVGELREEIGPDEFDEVAELFLEEVEEALESLSADASPQDVGALLHFLKGSALNIGFEHLAAICSEGERLAAAGDAAQVDVAELLSVYGTSRKMLLANAPDAASA